MSNAAPIQNGTLAPPGGRWRAVVCFLPILCWALAGAGLIAMMATLSQEFRDQGHVGWLRLWGRVPLALCGIHVTVYGKEHIAGPGPKIVLFNHVSLLDMFVLSSLCPPRPLVLYKKEFEKVPGLGRLLRSLGMIAVDRSNIESAIASVTEAGERIQADNANCFIAPEGTRSRSGGLQTFKKGAFHLAAEHKIPVVPMIMRGIEDLLPMGAILPRSGEVRIDYLEPVDTSEWERCRVREHSKEVRRIFLQYLPPEQNVPSKN